MLKKLLDQDRIFFLQNYLLCTGRFFIQGHQESNAMKEDEMAEFVDTLLEDQDRNDDGYIDYPEFVASFTHQNPRSSDGADSRV